MTEKRVRLTGRGEPADERSPAPTEERLSDGQHADHWILSDEERAKGFVRPVRRTYVHEVCGVATTMPAPIAQTYAREPSFYGSTFCCGCKGYFRVGEAGDFVWDDGTKVGT